MKNLKKDCCNSFCSHIYVETKAFAYPRTKQILSHFPYAEIIEIHHYKDVFCRRKQNFELQHAAQHMILAVKSGTLVYPGAPVCQNFGNDNFYYTSCIMNCIYNCEYCYLKGMYPSGMLVVFVNLEDILDETRALLRRHPVYLCVSYDTDLAALDSVTGYIKEWIHFVQERNDVTIEIRTKCANLPFESWVPLKRAVFAFTLSPQAVIDACEHGTASLPQRISCAAKAVELGFSVRLCFDPMLYCRDWKMQYDEMLQSVFSEIDAHKILDISVGTFRVSQDYLKKMRKQQPYSAVVQFPYENKGGVYQYPGGLAEEMERFLTDRLHAYVPAERIFLWKEKEEVEHV